MTFSSQLPGHQTFLIEEKNLIPLSSGQSSETQHLEAGASMAQTQHVPQGPLRHVTFNLL